MRGSITSGWLLFVATLLVALSCSKEPLVNPAFDDELIQAKALHEMPFQGVYTTYPVLISDQNGLLTFEIPSEGKATFLGDNSRWFSLSRINTNIDLDPETAVPEFPQRGDMTFTAENGDLLFGEFLGMSIPGGAETPFAGNGSYTITGGTGQFVDCTGYGTYYYSLNADFIGRLHWDGMLVRR